MSRFTFEATYNFNKRGLRGAAFNVLPFLRLFPPAGWGGYSSTIGWTMHFGWLWWTCIVHQYRELDHTRGLTTKDMNAHARDS